MKSGEPNVGIRRRTAFALEFILSILSKESGISQLLKYGEF